MPAIAEGQIIGEIATVRHRSRRRPAGSVLLRLAAFLTAAALCSPAGAQEGGPQMRTAELVGVPIKAVNYANSHGVLARSPEGREGMFYIGYYSTTGSELVGYHAASGEQVRISLEAHGGYGACVGPEGEVYIGAHWPGNLYRYDPATGRSFFMSERIEGAEPLDDYVARVFGGPLGRERVARKRRLIGKVAALAARFHRSGFSHRDFYLCHFLVREAGDDYELFLIDLHSDSQTHSD